jgi:hypothetical protein
VTEECNVWQHFASFLVHFYTGNFNNTILYCNWLTGNIVDKVIKRPLWTLCDLLYQQLGRRTEIPKVWVRIICVYLWSLWLIMKIVNAVSIPRNMLPELLLSLWQKRLGKAFRFTKFETSVIENVAAVPVFVAKQ